MAISETLNLGFLETQYEAWQNDPQSVSEQWQLFFKGFELAAKQPTAASAECGPDQALAQSRVDQLIHRYRDLGHLLACLDPLTACPTEHPLLTLDNFDLSADDLDRFFYAPGFGENGQAPLREIVSLLKTTYCREIGVEYMHLQDPDERSWLQERMESSRNTPHLDLDERIRILDRLCHAAVFEQFLNKKYVGVTRFSLEGGDALIAMLDALLTHVTPMGCSEVILGMAHRGRLNVLTNLMQKPLTETFAEFETCYDPDQLSGDGDVKYHIGYLSEVQTPTGEPMRIYLVNNPSHLEAVDPVVEGVARGRQGLLDDQNHNKVLPLLLHGDAAFAGQGVVAEVLNMSQLDGYRTGGTIHIVINNQIGYTTLPKDARSTRYSTDVAKMLMVPIFHVHGENPEAVVHVIRMAADYRMRFGKDVVIDLVCYRRYGHNEGDEPYFTQPLMYQQIKGRPSPHRIYADLLIAEKSITAETVDDIISGFEAELSTAYEEVHGSSCLFPQSHYFDNWEGYHGRYDHKPFQTGLEAENLVDLARSLNTVPEDFNLNRKLKGLLRRRLDAVEKGEGIDWGNAEALAFGSLLTQGVPVRLSGQDCARGTFSQRHSVVVDTDTGETYTPLNHLAADQAIYTVYNSLLAETSVLGFEYGYSLVRPESLTMWEAQFGDFVNNAQPIIDLFIASGESKWERLSGLVLLLPHGLEGLGPEHSSARPERFLQLCAENNMQVCNPTTPAQYFHLLRRQMMRRVRKPLIVLTPKSLLRLPQAVSTVADLGQGGFSEILADPDPLEAVETVLLCSGKLYYELIARRRQLQAVHIALVRLEQLYPLPQAGLAELRQLYPDAQKWVWVQEEPQNMGAWQFVRDQVAEAIDTRLEYIGRKPSTSPATGFPNMYRQQQAAIIDTAVGRLSDTDPD